MAKEKEAATLPTIFYTMPRTASATMTTRNLRSILLETEGSIIAKGVMWDICNKHLGAGVYRVTLKERE